MAKSRTRRRLLTGIAATWSLSGQVQALRALAPMTDGPYYPPRLARDRSEAREADLTQVTRGAETIRAQGEYLLLEIVIVDRAGRPLDHAAVEIWQCDVLKTYHHPDVVPQKGQYDEGFAGSGRAVSGKDGLVRFRTIRPVAYGGNAPHIHLKAKHADFGVLTSRLWVEGDPDNARDFNWAQTDAKDRPGLAFRIGPAPKGSDLRWVARHTLVMPI